jgi:uncharacterized protein (TIGR02453 family)
MPAIAAIGYFKDNINYSNFMRAFTVLTYKILSMETVFSFLRALARSNNREWFADHKKDYQDALEKFRGVAEEILAGISQFDPSLAGIEAKDAIFRIYKDIRFSKDKTPYKTHFGCWMTRGGRKSSFAGYYFHLEPDNSFMAAGIHSPPRELLNLIRQEIVFNPEAYLKVINDPLLQERYERGGRDDMLKKGPAGFPNDFEHMEELRYKHYIYARSYPDAKVYEKGFVRELVKDFRGLFPLVAYMNHAISFTCNE